MEAVEMLSEGALESTPLLWKNSDRKAFSEEHVLGWIEQTTQDKDCEFQVIVGTDSHMHGRQFRFISMICVYKVGKGGNFYFQETYEPRENYVSAGQRGKKVKGNQKMRMFKEVEKSISLADMVMNKTGVIPVIHIDASPKHKREFTSEFVDQLMGYVTGAGYEGVIKPLSFVAHAVADKYTK